MGVRHSTSPHYYSLLTVLLNRLRTAKCAIAFDRNGQYVSSVRASPETRGLVQLLVRLNTCSDVNQQINVKQFLEGGSGFVPAEIQYLEPTFPDEYSKRKGSINDPELSKTELVHPLFPVLHETLIQTHKLFSSSLLNIAPEEGLFDLPQQPQIENIIPFY